MRQIESVVEDGMMVICRIEGQMGTAGGMFGKKIYTGFL